MLYLEVHHEADRISIHRRELFAMFNGVFLYVYVSMSIQVWIDTWPWAVSMGCD